MQQYDFDLKKIAHFLISLTLIVYMLIVCKQILMPFVFGILFSFMLKPICSFFERGVKARILSIFLAFIMVVMPLLSLMILFAYQLIDALNDFTLITERVVEGINSGFDWLNNYIELPSKSGEAWLSENLANALDEPFIYISNWVSSSTQVLTDIAFIALYTFFLLLYRDAFYFFFLGQFSRYHRTHAKRFINEVQRLTQQYLFGLGVVIIILGLFNSAGLMLIDIDYAFFWGFLAAFLAIIPYIGTFLGGLLPFLYALATTETIWQPLGVILLFGIVQAIEGNLLTPRVVGGSVKINSLMALIALILGSAIWGVGGLILALPLAAILKLTFEQTDALKPLSLLMSDDLLKNDHKFLEDYNQDKYRLSKFFRKKK